jgi:hypothetical protein
MTAQLGIRARLRAGHDAELRVDELDGVEARGDPAHLPNASVRLAAS